MKRRTVLIPKVLLGTLLLLASAGVHAAEVIGGWTLAEPDYDQELLTRLDQEINAGIFREINSIVVIRDGKLLIERYYNGADRDTPHNPRSVGKTFAGTVLGIAIDQGYVSGADAHLSEFYQLADYANYSPEKAAVSLRELITMTSGFEGYDFDMESVGNEEYMYPQPDWVRWTLDLPMAKDHAPGEEWRYFTAGIVVLGDILNRSVPGGLEAYAHQQLFAPLGIDNYEWQHTPQKVANTAGGLQLTPLDFAKYGELYRKRGRWEGEQIVPQAWVEASLAPLVETTVPGNRYGYLWWNKTYTVGEEGWLTAYCSGNGGNKIFVFEQQKLVVVITASAYGRPYMHTQVDEIMVDYLLPAVKPAAGS